MCFLLYSVWKTDYRLVVHQIFLSQTLETNASNLTVMWLFCFLCKGHSQVLKNEPRPCSQEDPLVNGMHAKLFDLIEKVSGKICQRCLEALNTSPSPVYNGLQLVLFSFCSQI